MVVLGGGAVSFERGSPVLQEHGQFKTCFGNENTKHNEHASRSKASVQWFSWPTNNQIKNV